jgi:pyridoxine 5-phosphate synthase
MTVLSVNVNKIALLRNSRGRNFPDLIDFTRKLLAMGVKGITVHPRQDERHVTRQDVVELTALLQDYPDVEFNIEGYPSAEFLALVEKVRPAQCTLVPDAPDQLTSDHGWDVPAHEALLKEVLDRLRTIGVRSSLFLDPNPALVEHIRNVGADRIELYTEAYASAFGGVQQEAVIAQYEATAARARELQIGINAGHDLDLRNLPRFLEIPGVSEVSIGHALVVESLEQGLASVIRQYLAITGESS